MTGEQNQTAPCAWFRRLTGVACPGCGLTQGFAALSHGNWQQAWHANPFAFPLFLFILAIAMHPVLRRWFPQQWQHPLRARPFRWGAPLLAGGMVVFGIIRNT